MPTSVHRAYNYASALKTLAWNERATSEWIERLPILTASTAVVIVFSIHLVPFAPRTIRRSLRQMLMTPSPGKHRRCRQDVSLEEGLPMRQLQF